MLLLVGAIAILNRFYIGLGLYYSLILLLIGAVVLYWRLAFHISVKETKVEDPIVFTASSSRILADELIKGRIIITRNTFLFFVKENGKVALNLDLALDEITEFSQDTIVNTKKALTVTTVDESYSFTQPKGSSTPIELPHMGNVLDQ